MAKRSKTDQTREFRELKARATKLDTLRSKQVANQVAAIDRLLVDGSYDAEMAALHAQLMTVQVERDELAEKLEQFRSAMLGEIAAVNAGGA